MTPKPHNATGRILGAVGALLALAALTAVLLIGENGTRSQRSGAGATANTGAVSIRDFEFVPAVIEVKAGTKVTFSNDDTVAHTASAEAFDTGSIPKGEKKTVRLTERATIAYICEFHPFMKGTVVVK